MVTDELVGVAAAVVVYASTTNAASS